MQLLGGVYSDLDVMCYSCLNALLAQQAPHVTLVLAKEFEGDEQKKVNGASSFSFSLLLLSSPPLFSSLLLSSPLFSSLLLSPPRLTSLRNRKRKKGRKTNLINFYFQNNHLLSPLLFEKNNQFFS